VRHQLDDLQRVLLVFLPGTVLFMITAAVGWSYAQAFFVDRRIAKATGRKSVGLLPAHVAGIAMSYMGVIAILLYDTYVRLDTGVTWRTYARSVFMWLGVVSLWLILRFERKRYQDDIRG
jgi:hypothetical protein